ncbi:hypothetical protein F4781DRAFT_418250 [Annulohypoxylon bovei var. microspora]|nr:hypothetical protein F4781DRAFT_418250 [Annulohypoxylon bovei var. microspora]
MLINQDLTGGHFIAGQPPLEYEDVHGEEYATHYYRCLPISYGIELQFLIPVLTRGQQDPHPDERRIPIVVEEGTSDSDISRLVTQDVLDLLRGTAQVPTTTHLGPPFPSGKEFDELDAESKAVSGNPEYSQWIVVTDDNLLPQKDPFSQHYTWVGVKVKSNKRDTSQLNHFDQVGRVIEILRGNLRIRLAPTTSLMIHVGESYHDPMAHELGPRHLRVFCTMWWFLENYVLELVHPSRRTHPECLPLRRYSRLARFSEEELEGENMHPGDFAYWYRQMHFLLPHISSGDMMQMEGIWRADNSVTIAQRMMVPITKWYTMEMTGLKKPLLTEGRGSVGFSGFCKWGLHTMINEHNNGHTGTLEFRSLESTLDTTLVVNWLAVVTRLFDFARRGNTRDIMGIMTRAIVAEAGAVISPETKAEYSGLQLLEDLGLPEQAQYFKTKIQGHSESMTEEFDTLFVPF